MQSLQSACIQAVNKTHTFSDLFYYYLFCGTRSQAVPSLFSALAPMRSSFFRPLLCVTGGHVVREQSVWIFCSSWSSVGESG